MGLIVQKFGGSSVRDRERLLRAMRIVRRTWEQGDDVVVVLSAQGDTTDTLLARARELTEEPPPRELDALLATGETASVALGAIALASLGVPAVSLSGWQVPVGTDGTHGGANVRSVGAERIRQELAQRRVVLAAGFQGVVFALSNVVIQSSVNIFGNIVVAGNSAAANLEGFVYMAMNAFYQTTLSFVSQNYGAGEQKRINRIVLLGEACVIVTGTLLGNMVVFFGNDLLQIYSNNPEVIAAGMVRLHYISMIYALCGIMDVMVGALRGIGYSIMPMIVSIVGVCVLRLIWLATVFQIPEFHKIETVYLSYPVTWILTSLVYIVFFVWIRIRSARKKSAPSAA